MKEWIKISLVLCSFGFFREMRPSEPFVTEFLSDDTGRWRNVTSTQINREIYPLGTYSYLGLLCVVFLITDILRYKPIIIASALVGIVLWSLLLWSTSIEALYLVQLCYGFFMASEVAYYTYMYAKVDKEKYQKVTGHARASLLSGRFIASVLAQVLYSFGVMDERELNYLSVGGQVVSLAVALCLPAVGVSIYMWSYEDPKSAQTSPSVKSATFSGDTMSKSPESIEEPNFSWIRARQLLWEHFIQAYSNKTVLIWSIFWAVCMGGFLQIQSYVQLLWKEIDSSRGNSYNGGAEAALTLLGAGSCLVAGIIPSEKFEKFDLWIMTICSLVEGAMIIISSITDQIWTAYSLYIGFGIIYMFMITLASATVAKNLKDDSFALVFGINTLLALIIQTILTIVVISETGFGLSIRNQFSVFGGYFIALGVMFLIGSFVKMCVNRRK